MPEPSTSSETPRKRSSARAIALICWIFSGASILASLAAIVVLENKSTGIFLGLISAGLCRILLGEVVPRFEQKAQQADVEDHPKH